MHKTVAAPWMTRMPIDIYIQPMYGSERNASLILGAAVVGVLVLFTIRARLAAAFCALHIVWGVLVIFYIIDYSHRDASTAVEVIVAIGLTCGMDTQKLPWIPIRRAITATVGAAVLFSAAANWQV
jgi:hypothetical protein